jgi:hypothetical protein
MGAQDVPAGSGAAAAGHRSEVEAERRAAASLRAADADELLSALKHEVWIFDPVMID